jgi:hypothetical protein
LTVEQKQLRVSISRELLRVLLTQLAHESHDIITLDGSWFDSRSDNGLMRMAPGEVVPDRERPIIQPPEFMLTVVWNPIEFHVLKALPQRAKFNAD